MTLEEIRRATPKTHVVLPVEVVRLLIDAAHRAYLPAFGGSQAAVEATLNAAHAAQNVVDRAIRETI